MVQLGEKKSPYEQLFRKKSELRDTIPFGALVYTLIPAANRDKLQDRGERCRFLGYGDFTRKGFRLLRESDESIFYSKDVKVSGNVFIDPLTRPQQAES